MKCLLLYSAFFLEIFVYGGQADVSNNEWTWTYTKKFTPSELSKLESRSNIAFAKNDIPPFSQLLLSWNAFRPAQGYYSFAAQVRNATTKEWGDWHKMMEWGADVQRSFSTKSDGLAQNFYVRLEVDNNVLADAFRVRIESHQGADLGLVRSCAVNISNFSKFSSEIKDKSLRDLRSVNISNVPKRSQIILKHPRWFDLCSPTATSTLVSYLSEAAVDPIDFADKVFDKGLNVYGSWPFSIAHAFTTCNGAFHFISQRLNSFTAIHDCLSQGIPLVVSVRGTLKGAPKSYPKGHLLLVVGWDAQQQKVICHDSAFKTDEETLVYYDLENFLGVWETSRRLAYVAQQVDGIT